MAHYAAAISSMTTIQSFPLNGRVYYEYPKNLPRQKLRHNYPEHLSREKSRSTNSKELLRQKLSSDYPKQILKENNSDLFLNDLPTKR